MIIHETYDLYTTLDNVLAVTYPNTSISVLYDKRKYDIWDIYAYMLHKYSDITIELQTFRKEFMCFYIPSLFISILFATEAKYMRACELGRVRQAIAPGYIKPHLKETTICAFLGITPDNIIRYI